MLRCQRHATLRSLQGPLCSAFCKNYPYNAANLIIGGQAFSDFDDVPLLIAADYDCASVVFAKQLSDPHGYDQISRKRGNKITLEEDRHTYTRTLETAIKQDIGETWLVLTCLCEGGVMACPHRNAHGKRRLRVARPIWSLRSGSLRGTGASEPEPRCIGQGAVRGTKG